VIGVTVGLNIERLKLELFPGPAQTRRTRLLSTAQARKARVEQFRYLAFDVARAVCLERIVGFSSLGEQLLDSELESC
jgi:hypothetical protein